jgi:hypothetical protein
VNSFFRLKIGRFKVTVRRVEYPQICKISFSDPTDFFYNSDYNLDFLSGVSRHEVCERLMFGRPVSKLSIFAISFLPRNAANLHFRIFRGPPWREIGSSRYAEGEFRQLALKKCPTCNSERKSRFYVKYSYIAKMYLWWAQIHVGDQETDQIRFFFWSDPDPWRSRGSSWPDLSFGECCSRLGRSMLSRCTIKS